MKKKVWTQRNGETIPIKEMGDQHLTNAYRMMRRQLSLYTREDIEVLNNLQKEMRKRNLWLSSVDPIDPPQTVMVAAVGGAINIRVRDSAVLMSHKAALHLVKDILALVT